MQTLGYASAMAGIDVVSLGMVKAVHNKSLPIEGLVGSVFLYALQPLILYKALDFQGVAVMNLLWDLISDFLVTVMAIVYFKEQLTHTKMLGIFFSFIAIFLLSKEDSPR